MSRQRLEADQRRDFFIYLDEFQNFISPSIAEILAAGRKYRVGLVLAHQELHQLQKDADVASAVMSNPHVRIVFRVGDADARALEKGFVSFEARDFQNLSIGEAIGRVERSDGDFNLSVALPEAPDAGVANREQVVAASRRKYATPRAEVEAALLQVMEVEETEKPKRKAAVTPPPPTEEIKPVAPSTTAPPVPEAPKETLSEKKEVPVETTKLISKEPAVPRDLGIGGAQHQATQKRIKQMAESLGFLATIEKAIPHGSVDLLLERSGETIACEIGITTSVDHEFGNVEKCLKAGFSQVAMISRPERLTLIAEAVSTALGPEVADRVRYYTPDEFITYLQSLPVPVAPNPAPTESIRRGRKVTRKGPNLTPEERRAKEGAHHRIITELLRKKTE